MTEGLAEGGAEGGTDEAPVTFDAAHYGELGLNGRFESDDAIAFFAGDGSEVRTIVGSCCHAVQLSVCLCVPRGVLVHARTVRCNRRGSCCHRIASVSPSGVAAGSEPAAFRPAHSEATHLEFGLLRLSVRHASTHLELGLKRLSVRHAFLAVCDGHLTRAVNRPYFRDGHPSQDERAPSLSGGRWRGRGWRYV